MVDRIVAIEGNIGSGKSSLLRQLKQNPLYNVVEEDVETWKSEGWLKLFYSDMKKFSSSFQLRTQLSHMTNKNKFNDNLINVVERSPLSNKYIFGQTLLESGFLHPLEYSLIDKLNELIGWEPNVVVVLLCDPKV